MIESAIISVSDKSNLKTLLKGLFEINPDIKIISSGGTAKKIKSMGYEVTKVADYTGFPEAPGGLVKTLHPKVHGGILLDPDNEDEQYYLDEENVEVFNLVVVNLYPFEKTVKAGEEEEEIVENIDIGGPTLIRSAAKGALRHGNVVPVVSPGDYEELIEELRKKEGNLSEDFKTKLAHRAFSHTHDYDKKINKWTNDLVEGK